ncbi:zinc finger protein 91-like [Aphidius gifuensis]|uniref:zinc finger protein 91-like n=1 Tax=Aphidius gifuensis TaxID=684658 RepID=UPI001CDBBFAE|nr:zinc finger protein 91-like [Aphidius gifuensis]
MNNKTSVNIPCSYCNKSYRTNFSLHRHIELRHKSLKQQILNNTEIRNILNQTLCNSDPINVSSISEDNDKKFCCPYCPKKYKSSSGLSDHKKTHLGKYIKCDKCTFSTNYQRNLRIHQSLVHNMAYDYQCEYCSKQYNIRKELTKHERRRHLELLPAESYFKLSC